MTKADERRTVGNRILQAREQYGLSQQQLGHHLDITRSAISQYEKDRIRPRPEIIAALAEFFKVDPSWFEAGKGLSPDPLAAPVIITEINVARVTESLADLRDCGIGREWRLPAATFAGAAADYERMVAIVAMNHVPPILFAGDKVLIDPSHRHGEGVFLVVDRTKGPQLRRYPEARPDNGETIVGRAVAYLRTL